MRDKVQWNRKVTRIRLVDEAAADERIDSSEPPPWTQSGYSLCRSLAGNLFCFEQVLGHNLDRFGYDAIREKLIDGRECDRGLALWLGSDLYATEAAFREGLRCEEIRCALMR